MLKLVAIFFPTLSTYGFVKQLLPAVKRSVRTVSRQHRARSLEQDL
jgi:hypothetical protein